MAGIYRQRHPERTVFYWVLFHYFDEFVAEYEDSFEREYGYFRPIIKEVVEKYLDCGNPKCGFARIRCRDCGSEFLFFLVSEGGSDRKGCFRSVSRFNDDLLRELFTREVFSLLVHKQMINFADLRGGVYFEAYFFVFFVVLFLCFILTSSFFM